MKEDDTNIWTRKTHRTVFDDAESLADLPTGSPAKQWISGMLLAAIVTIYGIVCFHRGHTTLFGRHGGNLDVTGSAGRWLAVSYMAVGCFIHFHYFWGMSTRLWKYSQAGKAVSTAVFLVTFIYALYQILA